MGTQQGDKMTVESIVYDSFQLMPMQERLEDWPNLKDGTFEKTSDEGIYQNCVGFVVGIRRWIDSYSQFWPDDLETGDTPEHYAAFFKKHGFEICADGSLENGTEKLAIYAKGHKYSSQKEFKHVAIQQNDGKWKSKMGKLEDIEHPTTKTICCGDYGEAIIFMRRPKRNA